MIDLLTEHDVTATSLNMRGKTPVRKFFRISRVAPLHRALKQLLIESCTMRKRPADNLQQAAHHGHHYSPASHGLQAQRGIMHPTPSPIQLNSSLSAGVWKRLVSSDAGRFFALVF
jgi:hypothetical protein